MGWLRVKHARIQGSLDVEQLLHDPKLPFCSSASFEHCEFTDDLWLAGFALSGLTFDNVRFHHDIVLEYMVINNKFELIDCECTKAFNISSSELYKANLRGSSFHHEVHFNRVVFMGDTTLRGAKFNDSVYFTEEEDGYLSEEDVSNHPFLKDRFESILSFEKPIDLSLCKIAGEFKLPAEQWAPKLWVRRFADQCRRVKNRQKMEVSGTNADGCTNMLFRRWVQDTNYLEQFKNLHPVLYRIWLVSCDCGRSFSLWLMWSVVFALGFAGLFTGLVRQFYVNGKVSMISFLDALYFSIVAFTTLGFGDITPATPWGKVAVAAEVVMGYLMLGGLISIFADKLARRS